MDNDLKLIYVINKTVVESSVHLSKPQKYEIVLD